MNVLATDELPTTVRETVSAVAERIWYSGDLGLLSLPIAAVIGARECTPAGMSRAMIVTRAICNAGFCVLSGLAEGIDSIAHRATLEFGGKTIAVLGTPIDQCYPKENFTLKQQIEASGLVISQFAPDSKVFRSNFPKRNALMAALSPLSFVIEAGIKSGVRHHVKAAVRFGHDIGFLDNVARSQYDWVDAAIGSGHGVAVVDEGDVSGMLAATRRSWCDRHRYPF